MTGLRDVLAAFGKAFGRTEPPVTDADILTAEKLHAAEGRFYGYCAGGFPSDYWPHAYKRDGRLLDRHEEALECRSARVLACAPEPAR